MSSINKYYDILGVTENATQKDLKRAYWKKAKTLHPDKNKAPDAKEQFILLQEAYEFLIGVKTGKINPAFGDEVNDFIKWWYKKEAEIIRERAKKRANMKRNQFLSDVEEFKQYYYLNYTIQIISILVSLFFLVGTPVIGIIYGSGEAIVMCLIIALAATPFYIQTWNDAKEFFDMSGKVEDLENKKK